MNANGGAFKKSLDSETTSRQSDVSKVSSIFKYADPRRGSSVALPAMAKPLDHTLIV